MGYAWAPQITGLVRGEPKPGQRHRSNGLAICMECMEERASKSTTLNRSLSCYNYYWHRDDTDKSGTDVWARMCDEADAYRSRVQLRDGRTALRGLRHDAVIGWAVILKPPPEMVAALDMSVKDIGRFVDDGFAALNKIEPRLFRAVNTEAEVWHLDEDSLHLHKIGTSKDKNGKYCGNLIDANLCVRINQEWPALMRGMGWPMDDLDLTDWSRMGDQVDEDGHKILDADGKPVPVDAEYRASRTAKRKRQGQSVADYGKQRAEAASATAAAIVQDAQRTAAATQAQAEAVRAAIRAKAREEVDQAKRERDQANLERDQARLERDAARAALRGDYDTWARTAPKPTAAALLGVLGAAIDQARTPPTSQGVGRAWAQMQHIVAARRDNPGPTAVEGPTR